MSTANVIAVVILVLAVVAIAGVSIYRAKKNNKSLTFDDFINLYGDQIIAIMQDVIVLLKIEEVDFDTKENYQKAIIQTTIDKIKENGAEFGIDESIISLVDTEFLTEAAITIIKKCDREIFSVLEPEKIAERPELYSDEVVEDAMAEIAEEEKIEE